MVGDLYICFALEVGVKKAKQLITAIECTNAGNAHALVNRSVTGVYLRERP